MSASIKSIVLHAVAALQTPGVPFVAAVAVAERTGLSLEQVSTATKALFDDGLLGRFLRRDGSVKRGVVVMTSAGAAAAAEGRLEVRRFKLPPAGRHWVRSPLHERIWRAMRISQKFGVRDLLPMLIDAADPGAAMRATETVRAYARQLERSGYLIPMRSAGITKRWMLVRDSGALCPVVYPSQHVVVDRNDGAQYALDARVPA